MKSWLILCAIFSVETAWAAATVEMIEAGGAPVTLASKWKMLAVEGTARALALVVEFSIPAGNVSGVTGDGTTWNPKWFRDGKLRLGLGAMNTDVDIVYQDGRHVRRTFRVNLARTAVLRDGCKKAGLRVTMSGALDQPIFIGARCQQTADRVLLSVSVPQEVEWDSTSIFESAGKGERWKAFDLSRANLGGDKDQIAIFNLKRGERKFTLTLSQAGVGGKAAKPKPRPSAIETRVGLGVAQLAGRTALFAKSGVGPLLTANLLGRRPYWWKLRAVADLRFVAPVTGQQGYLYAIGTGPGFKLGRSVDVVTALEYVGIGQDQTVDGQRSISLQTNGLGLGAGLRTGGAGGRWAAHARYNGVGGDSTVIGASLTYLRRAHRGHRWGATVTYQSAAAKALSGSATFSQVGAAVEYAF